MSPRHPDAFDPSAVAAVVLDWDSAAMTDRGADLGPLRRRVGALLAAGVHMALTSRDGLARIDGQLQVRRPGRVEDFSSGRLWLCPATGATVYEIGPSQTELRWQQPSAAENEPEAGQEATPATDSHALRWVQAQLAEVGIGSGQLLVVGAEFGPVAGVAGRDARLLTQEISRAQFVSVGREREGVPAGVTHRPGGQAALVRLFDEILTSRSTRRVPGIDHDPAWTLRFVGGDPVSRRVRESLLCLSSDGLGTRGTREEEQFGSVPLTLAAGLFDDADPPRLLPGPQWASLDLAGGSTDDVRVLDLRTGVLWRAGNTGPHLPMRSLRFVSAAQPGVVALRCEAASSRLTAGSPLRTQPAVTTEVGGTVRPLVVKHGRRDENGERIAWRSISVADRAGITAAALQRESAGALRKVVDRIAAFVWNGERVPVPDEAIGRLRAATSTGFDRLLAEHRAAWAERWSTASVAIEGDPEAELLVRLALFHLIGSAPASDEAAVGARGVSGVAYGGHVFWDSDIFVLPVLAAVHPPAARAMLEYRIRRLGAARAAAANRGQRGARFPWESADTGRDVTPRSARDQRGEVIPILTGIYEEHITADIAWAALHYLDWTNEPLDRDGGLASLVVEGARYWVTRARWNGAGRAHIDSVIGPDEYHERVDDNAFTNLMARWNLRRAAELVGGTPRGATAEANRWLKLADALVDGYDAATGLYEQFKGFFDLEPLVISVESSVPVAADLLLGRDRVQQSQVLKQADVLMAHHLIPEVMAPGSLIPNLDFYLPRTAHGSSLSPGIHAALQARAGRPDDALKLFRVACRLDLDDLTGSTAGGLHLAAMASVWHALVFGFCGVAVRGGALSFDPKLPRSWTVVEVRMQVHGSPVVLRAGHDEVEISTNGSVPIVIPPAGVPTLGPPERRFRAHGLDAERTWIEVST